MENRKSLEVLSKSISETLQEMLEESRNEKEELSKQIESLQKEQSNLQKEVEALKKELSGSINIGQLKRDLFT